MNDNKKARKKGHKGCKEVRYCCALLYLIADIDLQDKLPDEPAYKIRDLAEQESVHARRQSLILEF